ncbi:uncharacterized protein F4822DRAFT_115524 [Hypoxylon trugodes]|uniref:uncharacterized protein n=1 Tax=Hypoxylon trugodes TaxID=326681 RepID=UPI00219318D0|nr:uncharacterized protein F4822DRAFT_115524 [Hypoxylon trugodes]KAI1392105.1 hypothetical protein F4822DRAFT_115524 [Hypoxylon trugodes]
MDLAAFSYIVESCGLKGFSRLPRELQLVIQEYIPEHHVVFRYALSRALAKDLSMPRTRSSTTIPLNRISKWERGDTCIMSEPDLNLPIVRLSIDVHGLQKVERLACRPPFSSLRRYDLVFVVENESEFSNTTVQSTNGLLRLTLPVTNIPFATWDTPTPPGFSIPSDADPQCTQNLRLQTIDLEESTGITFFYSRGFLHYIHNHTRTAPRARFINPTIERPPFLACIYVPIPPQDKLVGFASQQIKAEIANLDQIAPLSFLFRFLLAGDVLVGFPFLHEFSLNEIPPAASLIYNSSMGSIIPPFTVFPKQADRNFMTIDGAEQHRVPVDPIYGGDFFSSAPLENVRKARVFYSNYTNYCSGILLYYENGSQRALGQCRVLIDNERSFAKPTHICFCNTKNRDYLFGSKPLWLVVEFRNSACNHTEDWTCSKMSGVETI